MSDSNRLGIEQARIITISTAHLSLHTRRYITYKSGNIDSGPSIALRDEGMLVNSYLGTPDALKMAINGAGDSTPLFERAPDLVLIQALARGLRAEWINFDVDGVECSDILPSYDDDGEITLPTGEGWRDALSEIGANYWDELMVVPSREVLEIIEAGQTPGLDLDETPEP